MLTVSEGINMFVGSDKKVSAESDVLSDMAQCKQLMRERFLGNMTDQDDVEQGSLDGETTDDETDSASV